MKPVAEKTEQEINKQKMQQCIYCEYSAGTKASICTLSCDYMHILGRRRGCSHDECVEKGIFKPKKGKRLPKALRVRIEGSSPV